jgi:putative ABC transport system permease protein
MRFLTRLALASALNRRWTLGLSLLAVALSVALLLGVERLRHDARQSFVASVSGTDLIVGARTGGVQLLLYAVFRIGNASNNINATSASALATHPAVAWSVPISLGDSHRGFSVVGTTAAYFTHFRHGDDQPLQLAQGRAFDGLFEVVIGSEVARTLGYQLDQSITLTHGAGLDDVRLDGGDASGVLEQAASHDDKPFRIVGIIKATGTPVDRSVHITLESMSALHLDWQGGAPIPGLKISPEMVRKFDLAPRELTAVLLGLKHRADVLRMQRFINSYRPEPLMAILPGVTLDELWQVVSVAERTLLAISALVVIVGLAGLVAVLLASLNERRRELAILRAVGARPRDIFTLLALEGVLVTLAGIALGVLALQLATPVLAEMLQARFGLAISAHAPSASEYRLLGLILLTGVLACILPAWRAYRLSLSDGLSPRI